MCQVNPTFLLSPYFRFDPGSHIGEIELTDSSQLPRMENMLWDHVRRHPEIDQQLVSCANTLKAASPEVIRVTEEPQPDVVSEPVRI
jgi:hypothetical protein